MPPDPETPYLLRVACPRCYRLLDPADGLRVGEFFYHAECAEANGLAQSGSIPASRALHNQFSICGRECRESIISRRPASASLP